MLSCRLSVAVGHRLGRPIIWSLPDVEPCSCSVEPLSVFFLLGEQHPHNTTAKNWDDQGLGQKKKKKKRRQKTRNKPKKQQKKKQT